MKSDTELGSLLKFLRGLRENNNRPWFEAHRGQYQEARAHFEDYVAALIAGLARTLPLGGLSPRDCVFRLNRDLRFSKDKTPYKPYMSAYIAPGGRKSRRLGYYVHIEPGNRSMIAGGWHEPEPDQIALWRQAIDRDPRPFKKIVGRKAFHDTFGQIEGQKLKTAPRGYPSDHPELELLRLQQVTVSRPITDRDVQGSRLLRDSLHTFRVMRPFLEYLGALS
jgi:uncharacterized protein (TIGR02453 family)